MKPADIGIAVLVAVTWGVGFIASRLALNEFSPELMTTLRFVIAALPCLFLRKPAASSIVFGETFGPLRLAGMLTVIGGIAIMLFSKRPQALPNAAGA